MAHWIRCDSPDSAKVLLALIVSGSFNGGSHPRCRLSTTSPESVDVELGPDAEVYLQEIQKNPQVEAVGPLDPQVELPDLWKDRVEMTRIFLTG